MEVFYFLREKSIFSTLYIKKIFIEIMTQKQSSALDKLLESIKELRKSQTQTDEMLSEKFAETDEQMQKTDENIARLTENINGVNKSIGLVEVKNKVTKKAITQIENQVNKFKDFHPAFNEYKIYGAIAGKIFPENLQQEVLKKGFFVIVQQGDHVEVMSPVQ